MALSWEALQRTRANNRAKAQENRKREKQMAGALVLKDKGLGALLDFVNEVGDPEIVLRWARAGKDLEEAAKRVNVEDGAVLELGRPAPGFAAAAE